MKKKKITKFHAKGYWKPTPLKMRKIGDTLLGVFSITSVTTMVTDDKQLAIASLLLGVIGKVLTNFFSEEVQNV
jgi:hypothetical protein